MNVSLTGAIFDDMNPSNVVVGDNAIKRLTIEAMQVRGLLAGAGLSHISDAVVAAMKPSIRLTLLPTDGSMYDRVPRPETTPVGVSKVGGAPDLPPDLEWPEWEGEPLNFLAQISLPEIMGFETGGLLPRDGMLYFFCDVTMDWLFAEEPIRFVFYAEDVSALRRSTPPASLLEDSGVLTPCRIRFHQEWTMPNYSCVEVTALALTEDEKQRYWETWVQWNERQPQPRPPCHRILGCPDVMYNDGRYQCLNTGTVMAEEWNDPGYIAEWVKKWSPEAAKCLPLLQMDSDQGADLNWGDAGFLYYFVHQDDLRARNFEKVTVAHEGH